MKIELNIYTLIGLAGHRPVILLVHIDHLIQITAGGHRVHSVHSGYPYHER